MVLRHLLGIFVYLIIAASAWAENIALNPSHPMQYTVVKGDTLWDIAGKFLTHPWQWPYLWHTNQQIRNPHLIYPGNTLYFSMVNGQPQLSLAPNDFASTEISFNSPGSGTCIIEENDIEEERQHIALSADGKLKPCIRTRSIDQAIEMIPVSAIAKYLSSPKVLSVNELNNSPYVIGFGGEHIIAGNNDKIYARAINLGNNANYLIYRSGQIYKSPETGEILGYEAQYVADTRLEQPGDPATLVVAKSDGEIRMGDRLMPNNEEAFMLNYFPKPPEQKISSNIISVLGGVSQIGPYHVVVLDKGSRDGLAAGHVLTIFKRGKIVADPYLQEKQAIVKLPDEKAGTLMIFRPFERVSYALVMEAGQAIHLLDKAETP